MEGISKKVTLVIVILGFVGGTGWLQYFLERSERRSVEARQAVALSQDEVTQVLHGFLRPLHHLLGQTKRMQTALTADQELERLEFAVDYLQQQFESLPESDWRRVSWKALIESILDDNAKAVELIENNSGAILREDFRRVSDEFVDHATIWAASWSAVVSGVPVPDSLWGRDRLLSPPYPTAMDSLLELEIQDRRRQAGM